MRLLNVHTLEFSKDLADNIPRYAIASHRWFGEAEVSLKDVLKKRNTHKAGYERVQGFVEHVKVHMPHVEWLWIDTCCIDQKHGSELSEAINSMFKWYANAEVCLAYLADVERVDDLESFKKSEWFRRGWTLQELLAPWTVVFLTKRWEVIGHKGKTGRSKTGTELCSGPSLTASIVAASGLPERVLNDFEQSGDFTIEEKLNWTTGRKTTKEEDMWYCLLGIFNVSMPIIYGERAEHAKRRLLEEAQKAERGYEQQRLPTRASSEGNTRASSNIPFRRDSDFVERGTLLGNVQEKLAVRAGRAALVGLGGSGKSQLAIECAYRLRERSAATWVFWIYAGNVARFEQGVRDIADLASIDGREDPKANILMLVRNWLRDSSSGKWVVVIDNADNADFLVEPVGARQEAQGIGDGCVRLFDYLPVCDHGSILITTRTELAALQLVDRSDLIPVNPMNEDEALSLLEKKLGRQEDKTDVFELAATLEYMPLAITQAAAYIRQMGRRCSIRQYLQKLQKSDRSKQSILDYHAGDLRRDREARNSIMLTWQISFDHIYSIRRTAGELLSLMSFCDGQAIPELLVRTRKEATDEGERTERKKAVDLSLGDEDSDTDHSDTFDDGASESSSNDGFDNDLAILQGYSFVSISTNASVFEMHGLVQLATRKWLESQCQLERWETQYIDNLYAQFPPGKYENWKTCQILFPHARSATELKPKSEEAKLKWATVMYNAAWYALTKVSAHDAEKLAMRSVKVRAKELGDDDAQTLSSKVMVALAMKAVGQWTKVEELEVQVLEINKKVLGVEHPDTLINMNNLALTYSNQGRWVEAEELQVQELEISKKVLGAEHPDTLGSISNLAVTYWNQGRRVEAEELQVQVLEISKKVLGAEHPDTLGSITNLALTYSDQGRWVEAVELQVQELEISKKVRGAEHPDTLGSISNLAFTYWNQGRRVEAEELQVQVLEISKKVLGAEHPDTLRSISNLALTYSDQGRWVEAEELYKQVLESRKNVLGAEHPNTLRSINNLALTYSDQGRWVEAEELYKQVLESRKKVLRAEHPDTLTSMENLAHTLKARGQDASACALMKDCASMSRRVLGLDHPFTIDRSHVVERWTQ